MKEKGIYHICNQSDKVIFRQEEDYLMFINRLASCSFNTDTHVLAFSVMSTHFHLIINTADLNVFIGLLKRNIEIRYKKITGRQLQLNISDRQIKEQAEIIPVINYVLKNSVHHNVTQTPFKYPYSSVNCYFTKELRRDPYYKGEYKSRIYKKVSELTYREYKYLFGAQKVSENLQIIGNKLVSPGSFVNVNKVRKLYDDSVRSFLYNMNKPLKEEIESIIKREKENQYLTDIPLIGKLNDIEVCEIIDSLLANKNKQQPTSEDNEELWEKLQKLCVKRLQFDRCI